MLAEGATEYGYRGLAEIELLKKQIAEETKEKYTLYKRIKELTELLEEYKRVNQALKDELPLNVIEKIIQKK
tara:strand:- start:3433 stop:3648 length:216 start_codon:yes stop_codon:yes gene_type:complete